MLVPGVSVCKDAMIRSGTLVEDMVTKMFQLCLSTYPFNQRS